MSQTLRLILADQLFDPSKYDKINTDYLIIESLEECQRLKYHQFRLVYLYTCLREYAQNLINELDLNCQNKLFKKSKKNSSQLFYFDLNQEFNFDKALKKIIKENKYKILETNTINDKSFRQRIAQMANDLGLELKEMESDMFLTPQVVAQKYLNNSKSLVANNFYQFQRARLNILIDLNGRPAGGSWSYDYQNRKKLPKNQSIEDPEWKWKSEFYVDVKKTIQKYFPNNPGIIPKNSWLPVNHNQAKQLLEEFVKNNLIFFGDYEDALTVRSQFVYHSVLSSCLNLGLLTPKQILEQIDISLDGQIFKPQKKYNLKLNSVEGFIRQIIGWREWVRIIYEFIYEESVFENNFFEAKNHLPDYFYYPQKKSQDLEKNLPLKLTLKKVSQLGWAHHIERLMILANWMTLNEYDPKECYDWFRSQFVDAFEWVMLPNVYGMGLFADGGIFATKPYISGGNYIKKMSDYPESKIWEKIWTDKFWEFLFKHKKFFSQNPRMNMLIKSKKNQSKTLYVKKNSPIYKNH